jgi:hypothetical protein
MIRAFASVALAVVFGVACRSAREAAMTSPDASGAAPAAAASAVGGGGLQRATIDVCAVLGANDMSAAVGEPIVQTEPGRDQCTYKTTLKFSLDFYIVRVAVRHDVFIGGAKQNAVQYMRLMATPDKTQRFVPGVPILGLGDDAEVVFDSTAKDPNSPETLIALARKGDSIVELIHMRGITTEKLADVAKKALPKVLAVI